jgi:RimJ/RimL family protein N-acetyltransferase
MTLRLRDGVPVRVRPVVPDDKALLQDAFHRLSPTSRYRRFMSAVKELSARDLERFTEIDYTNHMAWVAIDENAPGHPLLAVARYVRLPHEPETAEVAVAVVDSHQGRGLGTLLLGVLSRSAAGNGIRRFLAYVLPENAPMTQIFRDLGATVEFERDVYRVYVPVPEDPRELPKTPAGRVFAAVARQYAS